MRRLRYDVLDKLVEEVRGVLDVGVHVGAELAQRVEDVVEERDKVVPGHLVVENQSSQFWPKLAQASEIPLLPRRGLTLAML